jgi:steroid delta-isomerase-like uncharacterized protein
MSVESTRRVMRRHWNSRFADMSLFAGDVVYTVMADGRQIQGQEAVMHMLNHIYRVAFDARAEITNEVIGDGHAVIEGIFTGTHIGEFAGIPVTGKEISVPFCVSYELENEQIKRARIYFEMPVLLAQLETGAAPGGA